MKTIIIADNQDITNAGIRYLIHQKDSQYQFFEAKKKKDLIDLLQSHPDAIVIIDYTLFNFESSDEMLILQERFNKSHWLLFSLELSISFLKNILYNNSSFSIITKESPCEEVYMALRLIENNNRYICNDVSQLILSDSINQKSEASVMIATDNQLTATEKIVLKEIAMGKTTKEIAAEKNLSFHTINSHRKNIFRKIGVNNVHEATKYAFRAGIIDLAEYYI